MKPVCLYRLPVHTHEECIVDEQAASCISANIDSMHCGRQATEMAFTVATKYRAMVGILAREADAGAAVIAQ